MPILDLAARGRLNRKLATVFDKNENIADRFPPRSGCQHHLPGDIAALRIEFRQWRNHLHRSLDRKASQLPQLGEKQKGVGPVQQQVRPRREVDDPLSGPAANGSCQCFWDLRCCRAVLGNSGQLADLGKNLRTGLALRGAFAFFEHGPNLIERRQREIDQLRPHLKASVANLVEGVLQVVRKRGQVFEAKHRAGALDGMEGAEHPAHKLLVAAVLVQFQQGGLQVHENLSRFFPEALLELVRVPCDCHPCTPHTYSTLNEAASDGKPASVRRVETSSGKGPEI